MDWQTMDSADKSGEPINLKIIDQGEVKDIVARWKPDGGGYWPWIDCYTGCMWNAKVAIAWQPIDIKDAPQVYDFTDPENGKTVTFKNNTDIKLTVDFSRSNGRMIIEVSDSGLPHPIAPPPLPETP